MVAIADAPVSAPVKIAWSERQIPFVQASSDDDLAVGLGVVHAHLRLAQLEMMRRVATGRLAEVLGPSAVGLDQALRTLDFRRAGGQALSALSGEARRWMESFLAGLNHQIARQKPVPHDLEVLGVTPGLWSIDELMALSRLASTDFSWRVWLRLLKLRGQADWKDAWTRLLGADVLPDPNVAGAVGLLAEGLDAFGRPGSNACVVGCSRTASGWPILAGDPHLAIQMPNLWLIVGIQSPSYHAVGMMVPGVPALGLGRTRHIAWGGTNLHASRRRR
jgi:penicillin amidase